MKLDTGAIIDGKYAITGVLGQGGMGTVYAGHHQRIGRKVAIKVLKASVAEDAEIVRRFEREAQAAARTGPRHIVEVYDVGQLETGEHYQILEYLDGESLSQRLRRVRTLPPAELFPLAIQLLVGLTAAHQAGIVHRDLKPGNIYLARDPDGDGEVIKILDFGISKFHYVDGDDATKTGTIVGTPHYMAPEQTRDASKADHRADLYSVGAVLYRALAGRTPFVAKTIHELIAQLIVNDPPSLGEVVPGTPPEVTAIVHKALAREPDDRYQNGRELAEAIRAWLDATGVAAAGMSHSGATWQRPSMPEVPVPADSWPSGSQGGGAQSDNGSRSDGVPVDIPTTPLHITPASFAAAADGSTEAMAAAPTASQPGGAAGAPPQEMTPPPQSDPSAITGSGALGPGAPTPPSLATPSPAFFDPQAAPAPSRKGVGLAVAGAAAVTVGIVIAAVVLLSGTETAPTETAPAATGAATTPGEDPDRPAEPTETDPDEEPDETAASASASAAPAETASASAAPTKPRPKPRPRPRPKPKPKPTTPSKLGDRDYRTDL